MNSKFREALLALEPDDFIRYLLVMESEAGKEVFYRRRDKITTPEQVLSAIRAAEKSAAMDYE